MDLAAAMRVELLTEEEYLELQKLGEFDTKTSSWVKTPAEIIKLGGALDGDRCYGLVFRGLQRRTVLLWCEGVPWFAPSLRAC